MSEIEESIRVPIPSLGLSIKSFQYLKIQKISPSKEIVHAIPALAKKVSENNGSPSGERCIQYQRLSY